MLLTFNSFDLQKIHYTNMATDCNSFRTVELAFAAPALSKGRYPKLPNLRNITLLTLLSLIYAEVFQEVSSVEILRPKCWIEFLIPCIRFNAAFIPSPLI
jgi:hypothetical protein